MIQFQKKTETETEIGAAEQEVNRFDMIRKTVAERHKKADTDGTRRRDKQIVENNKLL